MVQNAQGVQMARGERKKQELGGIVGHAWDGRIRFNLNTTEPISSRAGGTAR
jgi:hypothetical protein